MITSGYAAARRLRQLGRIAWAILALPSGLLFTDGSVDSFGDGLTSASCPAWGAGTVLDDFSYVVLRV